MASASEKTNLEVSLWNRSEELRRTIKRIDHLYTYA